MSQDRQVATDSSDRAQSDAYDPHIIPAETAARKEREGGEFKTVPTEEREASAPTDDQTDPESIHTTGGYTVDQEGLLNNYAIEPEIYYEVPGDARQVEEELHEERVEEYREMNQDEEGKLTMEGDQRGRGTGAV
ncbi:MAG: hypothetical protein KME10_17525 [Plectolyngbya sp. WJT66-NPBG17]|jgi:hypothetical protein|nr:hypothetical protein [Plectolyngbya sp. WJT66-NPBG17]MBW4525481.1 hypothetical protein [Phormidium tanganyikae FI6-MK23]